MMELVFLHALPLMKHKQITYVRMPSDGWHPQHITHLGSLSADWPEMAREDVIADMERGLCLYVVQGAHHCAMVRIVKPDRAKRASWYLATELDGSPSEGLLALPRYGEVRRSGKLA